MALSTELISQFAKIVVKDDPRPESITVNGTAKFYDGKIYVQIDGSNGQLTPIASSTVGMKDGDRVTVQIKNHSATVTGNATDPSAGKSYADDIKGQVDDVVDQISEFEIVIADKVSTDQLDAVNGRIDNLVSDNVTIKDKLTATEAEIDKLTADNVSITGKLEAAEADIDHLNANMLTVDVANATYATIANLEATNANIHNLEADYGDFKDLATDRLDATDATIKNLDAEKLDATEADLKYANIDFANIGKAAIENFFAKSGMIGDLVVGDGTITGTLVGVTIKGDLIEGGTVVADKLVIKGTDGLYYKLNTDGETVSGEQTEYNSLNGQIITAKSITAEKISVNDLVAFGATIGGFHITESALYSGVKESIDNTTRGTYMDDQGQFAIGDQSNYLKFFHDTTDDTWKLSISAGAIRLATSGKDLEEIASDAIIKSVEQFYMSDSPTTLTGGSWSASQPTWQNGKYIWRRTEITYGDGSTEYQPNQNGVCITGNTGAPGAPGAPGADAITINISSSNGTIFKNKKITTTLTAVAYSAGSEVPSTAGELKWYKDTNVVATGTGREFEVDLDESVEKAIYTVKLEDDSTVKALNSITLTRVNDAGSIDIGGRNYVVDRAGTAAYSANGMTIEYLEDAYFHIYGTNTGTSAYSLGEWLDDADLLVGGQVYTLSTTVPMPDGVYLQLNTKETSDGSAVSAGIDIQGDGETTFTTGICHDPSTGYANGFFGISPTVKEVDITFRVKFEKGNRPTDWSPAPEDTDQDISDATEALRKETSVLLEQTSSNIRTEVEATYTTKDEAENIVSQLTTSLEQTENSFNFSFEQILGDLTALGDDTEQRFTDISRYIRFVDGNIILGEESNPVSLKIENDRIAFLENGNEVMYISNEQLYIMRAIIATRLDIGQFAWVPRSNGNVSFRYNAE